MKRTEETITISRKVDESFVEGVGNHIRLFVSLFVVVLRPSNI